MFSRNKNLELLGGTQPVIPPNLYVCELASLVSMSPGKECVIHREMVDKLP